MSTGEQEWADFCIDRLDRLCRLRRHRDVRVEASMKRLLQGAIFSVYLDCLEAGIGRRAHQVLAELVPESCGVPIGMEAPAT